MVRIKELRLEKGLSQKELANILGCNQTAVGKYERGYLEPNITILNLLADFFEVSVDYLIGRSDDFGNVNVITNGAELSKDEKTLLDCFDKLGPFEREAIMIQIKALARKSESETIKK